ncbi:Nif3-like dinuclear metal center hexameric protein [Sporolituus thermophilus]|uniref:GTP cyclohydrolase 1 type 2 homolog n=1 Tax=Sporolituus thermophilus DSM 23256 TaxID=1123285 RepID=A0A1G7L3F5_9FIRM|nr:Nif3-like dinuclear metal center hexameric protein [Sporolituus thermophilus]SDF44028.1 NIF3 (NGG1p interacting factor 3) [Sporolituus thermophilus DSM 23256]
MAKVKDVLDALDKITGGRCVKNIDDIFSGKNQFVVNKTSNIPGKACIETPGLVCGNLEAEVKKLAVTMTLTECNIELAGATGVDAIVAHHPVMEAANSGGVTMRNYLNLYGLSVFELHEAFHGLHPGIAFIHGHKAFRVDIAYGGIPGNILYVGKTLDEVKTLGDILDRLNTFMGLDEEHKMLIAERNSRSCNQIMETNVATGGKILAGNRDNPVNTVIHIFPHTGFTPEHLVKVKCEHPEADTVLASISRVRENSALVAKAKELGMNFIIGNSHAMEILENGLPLAVAIRKLLPDVEVVLFRERITSTPITMAGTPAIREYAENIAERFLLPNAAKVK